MTDESDPADPDRSPRPVPLKVNPEAAEVFRANGERFTRIGDMFREVTADHFAASEAFQKISEALIQPPTLSVPPLLAQPPQVLWDMDQPEFVMPPPDYVPIVEAIQEMVRKVEEAEERADEDRRESARRDRIMIWLTAGAFVAAVAAVAVPIVLALIA